MKHLSTYLLCFLFFLPTLGFAQATVSMQVKGQLKDSITNENISYATVRVVDKLKPSVAVKAFATDDAGRFNFTLNKKADYILTVNYVGKKGVIKHFTVGDQKSVDLGVLLMGSDDKVLKEVVVAAQKPIVKIDLDKITYNIEEDPDSKTSNVLDMLKKVPMITVDGEDNVQLKGSTSFKIYLNGKPSNMISNNPKDVLKSMPANTIKDIEIITDPGAKYDAEGLAGIINIITVKNTSMGGYTANVSSWGDTNGGIGGSTYLSFKYGKLGFTGNYGLGRYKGREGTNWSYRESKDDNFYKYLNQDGRGRETGTHQHGSGEFSYEIDTLNLINLGYSGYLGKFKAKTSMDVLMETYERETVYSYDRETRSEGDYGGPTVNLDYQRTSAKVKDRLLTASYRFSYSPNNSAAESYFSNLNEYLPDPDKKDREFYDRTEFTDASMKTHTFQLDYTTPFKKIHTFEAGLKYIYQLNESESGRDIFKNNAWVNQPNPAQDRFKHKGSIPSAYAGYNLKYKKYGFKAGLRYEGTYIDARYPKATDNNFSTDYSNIVPSVTFTYQLKPTQTIRLGYNMRIQRPGIWQLNPYVNNSDPQNISMGNPHLGAAKSHNINANYSYFSPKFNMNASASYGYVGDAVERITTKGEGDVFITTYKNIGKNNRVNLFTYFSWNPVTKFRLTTNLSGGYTSLSSNDGSLEKNTGFTGNFYSDAQLTLPKSFRISAYGGGGTGYLSLQTKGNGYFFHGLNLSKSFMKDRLTFRLGAQSPFQKWRRWGSTSDTDRFYSQSKNYFQMQRINFSASFRFGEMKAQIKKAKRGISDDGGQSGNQGGGQQGGGQGGGN